MKFLLDANLSPKLINSIGDIFPNSTHVFLVGLGPDDEAIWNYAKEHDFVILSKDSDFYRFSVLRGAPPKVAWLKVGNDGTEAIAQMIRTREQDLRNFDASPSDALLVLGKP